MDQEQLTQTEDIVLRFRTSKPLGLLLITSTVQTGDRIELAVAAGRIRMALRLGVKDKKQEDKEKDKVGKPSHWVIITCFYFLGVFFPVYYLISPITLEQSMKTPWRVKHMAERTKLRKIPS